MKDRLLLHYRILDTVGQGGMGVVYLAQDDRLERQVALKLLAPELAADAEKLERFQREARAVAALNHPNIVTIHSVEEADGHHFLTMEYIDGKTLDSAIPPGGFPSEAVIGLALRIVDALVAAHEKGILHRDLKPSNIMVTREGRVKVLDFGLAKILEKPTNSPKRSAASTKYLTQDGILLGTLPYMSPEQVRGRPNDPRSDLFSLGVILYQVTGGRLPFSSESAAELMSGILRDHPQPLASPDEPLRFALWCVIERCLEKAPDDRYDSASALRSALENLKERPSGAFPQLSSSDSAKTHTTPQSGLRRLFQACVCFGTDSELPSTAGSGASREWRDGHHPPGLAAALARHGGVFHEVADDVAKETGLRRLATFDIPADAVAFALETQAGEAGSTPPGMGIQLGDIVVEGDHIRGQIGGIPTLASTARLAALAEAGQILLGRMAFDSARGEVSESPSGKPVEWLAHGRYVCTGLEDPLEVFEVGLEGVAPLTPPAGSEIGRRRIDADSDEVLGWRPAAGLEVPQRPGWLLQRPLGKGGFGEVWHARHANLDTERVFKFCFEPEQLKALKREVALFRLLQRSLGGRRDIARLLDWQVDESPYFLESEYHGEGNLREWADARGGLKEIAPEVRLEIVAQVADALAAAHGVGVLHKDVKPSNVLVASEEEQPRIWLSDFGIGTITNRDILVDSGVTEIGLTQPFTETGSDGAQGTRNYMAPELSAGSPATIRSDIYSLGVLLYQMVVGDLSRILGHGWERHVEDPELQADIRACVDVEPEERLGDASELAHRLRALPERRVKREEELRQRHEEAEADLHRQEQRRHRQRLALWAALSLAAISLAAGGFTWRQTSSFRGIVERSTETVVQQVLETNRSASYWVAQALESELSTGALSAERIAADPELIAALARGLSGDCEDLLESRRTDLALLPLRGLSVFGADGTMIARSPPLPDLYGRDYSFRDYFSAGDPDRRPIRTTHVSEPYVSQASDSPVIFSIAAPIWPGAKGDGDPIGVITASLEIEHLSEWVKSARLGERTASTPPATSDMDVVILNERGQVVVHSSNPLRTGDSANPVVWPGADALLEVSSNALELADPLLGSETAYPTGLTRLPHPFGWLVLVRSLEMDRHPATELVESAAAANRSFFYSTVLLVSILLLVVVFITALAVRSRRVR